jgi:hypothetical protein
MNDIRASQLVISKTQFVGTVSQTVRSGNEPYNVPCLHGALHTVFSTTQLGHLITQCESCHHTFRVAYF